MINLQRLRLVSAGCAAAVMLAACGGGGNDSASVPAPPPVATNTGDTGSTGTGSTVTPVDSSTVPAPALTGDIATDGLNWFNYRRTQLGVAQLTRNSVIDQAALAHSSYQNQLGKVTHDETAGNPGFTGVDLQARLAQKGYTLTSNSGYAIGEVIAGTTNKSGAFMAEELITAIYHRFVAFEPVFKEMGGGTATNASGYTYFTTDFGANNGQGPGIAGVLAWPYNGQTNVVTTFLTDNEEPDALPNQNEAGYPVSVHANISGTIAVTTFTIRQRGASTDLSVRLLTSVTDREYTSKSVAAIVPLAPLKAGTVYDVTFVGNVTFPRDVGNTTVNKSWSFTTK
jgi:uncharacterized protein YkwD